MKDFLVIITTTTGKHKFECKAKNLDDAIEAGREYAMAHKLGCVREIGACFAEYAETF